MIVTHKLTMDLVQRGRMPQINAVQGDSNTRVLELTLQAGGSAWTVPQEVGVLMRYSRPDGMGGSYDTLEDGQKAWSVSGGTLSVMLAPRMLEVPGCVFAQVELTQGNSSIATFMIEIIVERDPSAELLADAGLTPAKAIPTPTQEDEGKFLRVADGATAWGYPELNTYLETDGFGVQRNGADADSDIWSQWNRRLAFGMDIATAPVPFKVGGQLLVDGTIIAGNSGSKDKNRWGYHVFEAYAKNNYARMTMLLDKHGAEAGGKPSLEYYYYIGANHHAASYGNTKIGSDVKYHSFCFDRDTMTAYGEIDAKMPITLARISLADDLDSTYNTVAEADAAYEPEGYANENNKCLKYIALKNAENGAMFYDTDRHQVVCKINGKWCDIPFTEITDSAYDIFNDAVVPAVEWESGVIGAEGANTDNTARIRTANMIDSTAIQSITANDGYEFAVCVYKTDGTTAKYCYWNTDKQSNPCNTVKYYTTFDVSGIDFGVYTMLRIIARRTDLTEMTASEGENILFA